LAKKGNHFAFVCYEYILLVLIITHDGLIADLQSISAIPWGICKRSMRPMGSEHHMCMCVRAWVSVYACVCVCGWVWVGGLSVWKV